MSNPESKKLIGGSAFPVTGKGIDEPSRGMSLRQFYAAKAMQGDWAAQNEGSGFFRNSETGDALQMRAKIYFRMADAMIALERKEMETPDAIEPRKA